MVCELRSSPSDHFSLERYQVALSSMVVLCRCDNIFHLYNFGTAFRKCPNYYLKRAFNAVLDLFVQEKLGNEFRVALKYFTIYVLHGGV